MRAKATSDSVLNAVRHILSTGDQEFSLDDIVSITKGSKTTVARLVHENAEAIEQMKLEGISLPVAIRSDVLNLGASLWAAADKAARARLEDQSRRVHALCSNVEEEAKRLAEANVALAEAIGERDVEIRSLQQLLRDAEARCARFAEQSERSSELEREQRNRADRAESRLDERNDMLRHLRSSLLPAVDNGAAVKSDREPAMDPEVRSVDERQIDLEEHLTDLAERIDKTPPMDAVEPFSAASRDGNCDAFMPSSAIADSSLSPADTELPPPVPVEVAQRPRASIPSFLRAAEGAGVPADDWEDPYGERRKRVS